MKSVVERMAWSSRECLRVVRVCGSLSHQSDGTRGSQFALVQPLLLGMFARAKAWTSPTLNRWQLFRDYVESTLGGHDGAVEYCTTLAAAMVRTSVMVLEEMVSCAARCEAFERGAHSCLAARRPVETVCGGCRQRVDATAGKMPAADVELRVLVC